MKFECVSSLFASETIHSRFRLSDIIGEILAVKQI
jgi:hypothetical protein